MQYQQILIVGGFTKRCNVHQLVWCKLHESMESAIKRREKRLKEWKRVCMGKEILHLAEKSSFLF